MASLAEYKKANQDLSLELSELRNSHGELTRAYNRLKELRQEQLNADSSVEARLKDAHNIIDKLHDKLIYATINHENT